MTPGNAEMVKMKETKTKLLPTAAEAAARWTELENRRRELLDRIDGIKAALALQAGTTAADDRFGILTERAKPFAGMKPRRLRQQLEDAEGELEALLPEAFAAREAADEAEARELRALAEKLRPEHRKAVNRIADALEELAAACEAEAGIRAQLQGRFVSAAAMLPNLNFVGVTGRPADWDSPISTWFRQARAAGYVVE